jgi:integrase
VAAVRAHRKAQAAERLLAGPDYTDHGLVFAEPDGSPIHPDRFRVRFEHRVERSGLPPIRFHDLRHTYATLALQAGVHAKVVSEILGHANIGITSTPTATPSRASRRAPPKPSRRSCSAAREQSVSIWAPDGKASRR